jgi:hypothetical protein
MTPSVKEKFDYMLFKISTTALVICAPLYVMSYILPDTYVTGVFAHVSLVFFLDKSDILEWFSYKFYGKDRVETIRATFTDYLNDIEKRVKNHEKFYTKQCDQYDQLVVAHDDKCKQYAQLSGRYRELVRKNLDLWGKVDLMEKIIKTEGTYNKGD